MRLVKKSVNQDDPGTYHLFCAEFCGTYHSTMVGKVVVMEPADYQKWLTTGNVQHSRRLR